MFIWHMIEVFLFCASVLVVTQRGIHTWELSVREALGASPSPALPVECSGVECVRVCLVPPRT